MAKTSKSPSLPSSVGDRLRMSAESDPTVLDLSSCGLTEIPEEVLHLHALKRLNLSGNNLSNLPGDFARLENLYSLELSQNHFEIFPAVLYEMTLMNNLSLSFNPLSKIHRDIGNLTKLLSLNLYSTKIESLPEDIANLSMLYAIFLGWCPLVEFPQPVLGCNKLIHLDIGNTATNHIPSQFGKLVELRTLIATGNDLKTLPDVFDCFKSIRKLRLSNNLLTSLPPSLRMAAELEELELSGNPLPISPETFSLPPADLLTVYFTLNPPDQPTFAPAPATRPLNEAKLLVVGQGGVGKTSLIRRLQGEDFVLDERETKGIRIQSLAERRDSEMHINIWDFGGQEIMHATHQFFFTDRSLYLLVIDSRRGEQESRLEYWLKLIASFAGDSPVIVVCNRSDENQIELDWTGLRRKYPAIVDFITPVSARTGEGVGKVLAAVWQTARGLDHVNQPLPESWLRVKGRLTGMRGTCNYISYREFQDLCAEEQVVEPASQKALVRLLTALGTVLNFADDMRLKDTNVLEPNWVTNGVYAILNCNELFQSQGLLELAAISTILPEDTYPAEQHGFIVEMMKKFELCFEFEGFKAPRYLVADLLPLNAPYTGDWEGALRFEYRYDILPASIMSRFIVRMHRFISKSTYWRRGVVLEREGHRALVVADPEERIISVAVTGHSGDRRSMLDLIRADFERIHETLPKLGVSEKVPVPDHPGVLVDYQHLMRLLRIGESTFVPEGMDTHISVSALLGEIETSGRQFSPKLDVGPGPAPPASDPKAQRLVHPLLVIGLSLVLITASALVLGGGIAALPIAVIGSIIVVVLVHTLEEHRSGRLGEKAFLTVVTESFAQLRLLRTNEKAPAAPAGGRAGGGGAGRRAPATPASRPTSAKRTKPPPPA